MKNKILEIWILGQFYTCTEKKTLLMVCDEGHDV